jgi:hypothetical protein
VNFDFLCGNVNWFLEWSIQSKYSTALSGT